ncbi:MAG: class I SAM-dependent methyltransferase [Geobacteraceae bacterium]|nr:class I SAM-dependent methyltransferase [Geobacteraceae bacterium]
MNLDYFAIKNDTDKSSLHHGYCQYYEDAIETYLKKNSVECLCLLEIGVKTGSSLNMWSDYLNYRGIKHKIVGIDIDPLALSAQNPVKNILVELGDQADVAFLSAIAEKYGPFDLVIDDGNHVCEHQHKSFVCLIKHIKNGGIYIIEDVCTSYWPEYNSNGSYSMVEYCKSLVDSINFFGIIAGDTLDRNDKTLVKHIELNKVPIDTSISSIHFCNSTILVHKR